MRAVSVLVLAFAIALPGLCLAENAQLVTATILCDNDIHDARFQAEWDFASPVCGLEKTIVFDAGRAVLDSNEPACCRHRASSH